MAPAPYWPRTTLLRDVLALQGPQGAHDLDLFVAHAVRREIGGRLHGGEAEELEEVVLHHVAQGAGAVVIGPAAFHAESLAGGDLDVIDVAVVPERLEDAVGETQHHDVLRGLLAEEVIDAEGIALREGEIDHAVQLAGGGEIGAEGLLDDDAGPAAGG